MKKLSLYKNSLLRYLINLKVEIFTFLPVVLLFTFLLSFSRDNYWISFTFDYTIERKCSGNQLEITELCNNIIINDTRFRRPAFSELFRWIYFRDILVEDNDDAEILLYYKEGTWCNSYWVLILNDINTNSH